MQISFATGAPRTPAAPFMACHFTAMAPLTTTGAGSAGGSTFVVAFGAGETDGDGVTEGDGVADGVAGVGPADVADGVGVTEVDGGMDSEGSGASESVPVGVGVGVGVASAVALAVAAPAASVDWEDGVAVADSSASAGVAARDPAAKLRSRAAVRRVFFTKHPLPRRPVRTGLLSQWSSRSSWLTLQPISLPGQFP